MKLKQLYRQAITNYGVLRFCRDYDIGKRWLYKVFTGSRGDKGNTQVEYFRYAYLHKLAKALHVGTDDLLE